MGVGTPPDLLRGDRARRRHVRLRHADHAGVAGHGVHLDRARPRSRAPTTGSPTTPLDAACACSTCRVHPRGYLHHLMKCSEPLGPRLAVDPQPAPLPRADAPMRAAIEAGGYAAFARETLEAIDRHEHDATRRRPGARFESWSPQSGAPAVRDRSAGEVMHPGVGAAAESEQLYVSQSGLCRAARRGGPAARALRRGARRRIERARRDPGRPARCRGAAAASSSSASSTTPARSRSP